MRLYIEADTIHAERATREPISLDSAARVLANQGHALARSIAHGELSSRIGTLALARQAGLVERVETDEARKRGLLK
jgi:hypothetical protein